MTMTLQHIQSCLQSDDEELRLLALRSLEGMPLSDSISLIFTAMGDESWRVRKESVEAFATSAPDEAAIEKLLELLRNEDNAGLRNSAAEAVIRLGAAAVLPLIRMAHDPDGDVRKFIMDLMGAIKDPAFVRPLLTALQDPDVNVASAAAEHLGSTGDTEVIPELVKAIAGNQSVLFRFSALGALSILAKPSAVPEAILELADQEILRKAVYDCLGSISDDSSLPLLMKGFSSSQKGGRAAALKSIFRIYSRSTDEVRQKINGELRSMNGKEVISGMLNIYDCRDYVLTEALIWFSDVTGDIRFVPVIIESFEEERFYDAALNSLANLGSAGISAAVACYPKANENARSALCTLIGETGYTDQCDLINSALSDNSARVRMAAAVSVARLAMTSSIPNLVALTEDSDPDVSSAAVSSLQQLASIGRSEVLKIARYFGDSEEPRHRLQAALLFASLDEHECLLLLSKDEDPMVRRSAISAIGCLKLKTLLTKLIMALVDEDPDVRIAAAEALGNIGDNNSLDALEQALEDEDSWVRSSVLKAIARIDRNRVLEIITRVHAEAEGLFMITCLQILETVGGSDARIIISDSLANPDPDIARQASMSLQRLSSIK